jgi:rhamnosyltransferase
MRISSITVAFNPDPARLLKQLVALLSQVDDLIVVDNGSLPTVASIISNAAASIPVEHAARIRTIVSRENIGIASAFNFGLEHARQHGSECVLLLDHDSVPAIDMVSKLSAGYLQVCAGANANMVAAVGPRIVDSRDALEYPFIRLGWFRNEHLRCAPDPAEPVDCDLLISSGSLISIAAFDKIGKFDDALFIDNVDVEWCCRARARGFLLYGVCGARLNHRLGDRRRVVLNQFQLIVHSPLRMYYQTRNRLLLYRRSYIPLQWTLKDFLRMVVRFVATIFFVAPRGQYLRMTILAMRDGFANRGGRFQQPDEKRGV